MPTSPAWPASGVSRPSHVAFAFAFTQPALATVLFGARSPEQLVENVAAWTTFDGLDDEQRTAIDRLADRAADDG